MRAGWVLLMGVVAGNTGCGGECLDGTVRHRDTCFPFDPFDSMPPTVTVDPPVRTRRVGNIKLISDEPAEIFATIDDAPLSLDSPTHEPDEMVIPNEANDVVLRYFAVDLAGNQSAEQIVLWNIDSEGPSPPSAFDLQLAGNQRNVSWEPPQEADYKGTVVARVEGRLTVAPIGGTTYAVGDSLGPGVTIVHSSETETSLTESETTTPGMVRYVAWAFDDLLNYGPPASDFELVALPAQTGTLIVSTTNGTVSQLIPASNLTFSGSATFAGGTVTAKITLRNDTTRVLFAPKVLVTNALGTVNWIDPDGDLDGEPFRAYGGAIAPGGQITTTWVFTNTVQGSVIALDFAVRDNPILMSSSGRDGNNDHSGVLIDEVTTAEADRLAAGTPGTRGAHGTLGGSITPDGLAVFGSRCTGAISAFDLQAGSRLLSKELRPQKSHVAHLAVDHGGGTGYAVVGAGHVRNAYGDGNSVETELVRFDVATLTEHGRIAIGPSRNRDLRISPDGRLLVLATGVTSEGAIVIDLATFKILSRLIISGRPDSIAFSPDGRSIAVSSNVELVLFDRAGFAPSKTIVLPGGSNRAFRIAYATANTVFVGRRNDTVKVDLGTSSAQVLAGVPRGRILDVFDGKVYLGDTTLVRLDASDVSEATFNLDDQSGHWLGRSPF